ncbi:MAG: helix-turn-helix transcriptional regulator [Clostridiales bacterium]|nr:helix-turn-helix transcriptional regulator [Clostridiales bacterium]
MEHISLCSAVARRLKKLLVEKNMSLYRLEQNAGIEHGAMYYLINEKNKNVHLKTVYQIAKGLGISFKEFVDDELFDDKNFDLK